MKKNKFKNKEKEKNLNKAALILGILVSIFTVVWSVYIYVVPKIIESNIDEELYGIWYSKYSYKINEGEYSIEGTTEYFKNNSYNFVGQVKLDIFFNYQDLSVIYNLDGAGTWSSNSSSFLTTMTDMNSFPVSVKYDNQEIDISIFENFTGKEAPNFDETIPIGTSEEFKVVKLDKDEIIAEVDDLQGKPIRFKMSKRERRFQR